MTQIEVCDATEFKWKFVLIQFQYIFVVVLLLVLLLLLCIDICTTMLNGFMCQLDLEITCQKIDECTKTLSWFANTKVYSLLHILVVIRERERERERERQSMKTELTMLARQRETKCHEGRERESRHRPWIIFLDFCSSSNMPVIIAGHLVWDPFLELTPKWSS